MQSQGTWFRSPLWKAGVRSTWRLVISLVDLALLYSFLVNVINKIALLLSGKAQIVEGTSLLALHPVATPLVGISIPLPDPLAEAIIACIVVGVITYTVTKWICESEWVQETVKVEKCWEEVKWYNPFSWFVAIVCTFVEVLKWVLKQICKWVEVIVTTLVVLCVVTAIVLLV